MEYYSDTKRDEVLIYATKWMNLKNILLGERRQTQNATYCMALVMQNVHSRQILPQKD